MVPWASQLIPPATSPVTPALSEAFALPPRQVHTPHGRGSRRGVPAAAQSLSQAPGRVAHRGAEGKPDLWAKPASENHRLSFPSLLVNAAAVGAAAGRTTAARRGPLHGVPGGPDTWGKPSLTSHRHTEQPRASLSVQDQFLWVQKERAAPSRGGRPESKLPTVLIVNSSIFPSPCVKSDL